MEYPPPAAATAQQQPSAPKVFSIAYSGPLLQGAANVVAWRQDALVGLQNCGAMAYIARPCLKAKRLVPVKHPAQPDVAYLNGMQQATGAIKATLSPAVRNTLTESQQIDPAELWQLLWDSNQPNVEQSLGQCVADMCSSSYEGNIETPYQQLKALRQTALQLCNGDATKVVDAIIKHELLSKLPEGSHLKTFAAITAGNTKDLDSWVAAISTEEARANSGSGSGSGSGSSVAMLAAGGKQHKQHERSGSNNARGARGGRNQRLPRCQLCERVGHTAKQCNAPGAPNAIAPGQSQPQQHRHAHIGETTTVAYADAGWPAPTEQEQQQHTVSYAGLTVELPATTTAAVAAAQQRRLPHGDNVIDIVADSGAGHHMFADRRVFTQLRRLKQPITITFGQGTAVATHGGDVRLHPPSAPPTRPPTRSPRSLLVSSAPPTRSPARVCRPLAIRNVLYVPTLAANLLSLPVLAQEGLEWRSSGADKLVIECPGVGGSLDVIVAQTGHGGVYRFHAQLPTSACAAVPLWPQQPGLGFYGGARRCEQQQQQQSRAAVLPGGSSSAAQAQQQPAPAALHQQRHASAALGGAAPGGAAPGGAAPGGAAPGGSSSAQQQQQQQQQPLTAEFVRPEPAATSQQQQQPLIEEPDEIDIFLAGLQRKPAPGDAEAELFADAALPPLPLTAATAATAVDAAQPALLWHCRMGHSSYQTLAELPAVADGVNATKGQFNAAAAAAATAPCVSCARGRLAALPHRAHSGARATQPAELAHSDVLQFSTPAKGRDGGQLYAVTLRDDATGFGMVVALRTKGEAAVALVTMLKALANLAGRPVVRVRTDNGSELLNATSRAYFAQAGITVEPSAPYSPQSNGVAERYNRALVEKARCLCAAAHLGPEYWRYALQTAAALLNRQPRRGRGGGATPYELLTGRRPDLSRLRVFGAKAYALVPQQLRGGKLAHTGRPEGVLVGFVGDGAGGGYLIERPNGSTTVRRDAVFDESSILSRAAAAAAQQQQRGGSALLPAQRSSSTGSGGEWSPPTVGREPPPQPPQQQQRLQDAPDADHGRDQGAANAQPRAGKQQQPSATPDGSSSGGSGDAAAARHGAEAFTQQLLQQSLPLPSATSGNAAAPPLQQRPQQQAHTQQQPRPAALRTQPQRATKGVIVPPEQKYSGTHTMQQHRAQLEQLQRHAAAVDATSSSDTPQQQHAALLALQQELAAAEQRGAAYALHASSSHTSPDPRNRKQAMASPHWSFWQAAEDAEVASINARGVWTGPVPLPPGVKPLPCIFVYKTKFNADGTIERHKARLVVRGDLQPAATTVAWAPTVRAGVTRLHLAHAARLGHEIHTVDISNAFLQGRLDGDVYVLPPEGYPTRCPPGTAFKLNRPLYGLRQSPRLWHFTLARAMQELGFKRVQAEPAAFVRRQPSGDIEMVSTHVDDLMLSARRVGPLKAELLARFDGRDLGPIHHHLSFIVEYDQPARTIHLHQEPMIEDLLASYNLDNARPLATPMQQNVKPTKDDGNALDAAGRKEYMSVLGSLLYLSVCSRPDIAYAVGVASRFAANPTDKHRLLLTHILRYLAGSQHLKLTYGPGGPEGIQAYTDADWATDVDTRRSVTGYVFNYYGGAITWASRRQSVVACSSTEAELIAACTGVKEALWLRHLCFELGIDVAVGGCGSSSAAAGSSGSSARTITLHVDNQSAIHLLRDPISSHRTKHIDVAYHFVHEHVDQQHIKFVFVPTTEQRADALTKPVGKQALQSFINFCGLRG